jgi:histidinol-phosphatase (PHP family)
VDPAVRPSAVLSSLHTHSCYDDGRGEIAEYAAAARDAGLYAYGASGHAPLPFPCDYAIPLEQLDQYVDDVRRARDRFAGELPVLRGLELDYLPDLSNFYLRELRGRGFDYFVASVHYVGEPGAEPWTYDESAEAFERQVHARHGGDARAVVEDYFRRVVRMVEEISTWGMPIIIGHLDRIVLWNRGDRYFPTDNPWYERLVDQALDAIAERGLVLELNTSGWIKAAQAPNPGLPILARAAARGIRPIITADAHLPANVALRFDDGVDLLRAAGFREIVLPDPNGWRLAPLPPTLRDEAPHES